MQTRKKVTVLVPCYNEEAGIASVVQGFQQESLKNSGYIIEVIVIDNNSKDNTSQVAQAAGAKVLSEPKKGKGNALRKGFYSVSSDTDYIVMLDGDDTYKPEEMPRLVELLDSGFCDVAIGSRIAGRMTDGSMSFRNRVGNWIFSHLVRYFYQVNVTDVLTGYFAWKREAMEKMRSHLKSEGFAIEMEMVTKMAKLGLNMYCVPITYTKRAGESNLRPFADGIRILIMFTRGLVWRPNNKINLEKLAFVSDSVMPWHKGGKEKRLYELSKRLVREGHQVHIYTMKWWNGDNWDIQIEGIHYHAISQLYPMYTTHGRRSILQALLFGISTLKMLFVAFDVIDVDHMPFYPLFSARIVCWLRGKRLYATWHEVWGKSYWFTYAGRLVGAFGFITECIAFRLPDVIISNSYHTTSRLEAAHVGHKVKTVTLGVDVESILASEPSSIQSEAIFVGRLINHKGADMLVRATSIVRQQYPSFRVIIIGDGPEKSNLIQLVEELHLTANVHILGRVESDIEIYGLIKASKMCVLPSTREGFGLSVAQAQVAGIPAITINHEDNAAVHLIKHGINGAVSNATDKDLAENMIHILEKHLCIDSHEYARLYDWQNVAHEYRTACIS